MQVTFDLKKLASALSKANKGPKQDRPVSYQDYLQFLSKVSGAGSYEALSAVHDKTPKTTKTDKLDSSGWNYVSVWSSGHHVSTPCVVNLDTMEIHEVSSAQPDDDVFGTFEEYVTHKGVTYQVVKELNEMGSVDTDTRSFALASVEDYEKATWTLVDAIENATAFRINGVLCQHTLDGDWHLQVQEVFENHGQGESMAELLNSTIIWHAEGTGSECHERYEFFISAYDLLFATLKVVKNRRTCTVQTEQPERPLVIEILS